MADDNEYSIEMDGEWELYDLYNFPHSFSLAYNFVYCFEFPVSEIATERLEEALATYPWKGGYSVVNYYQLLERLVPFEDRPRIKSIKYASPGVLELFLSASVAAAVAASVAAIIKFAPKVVECYAKIQKSVHDIRLQRRKHDVAMQKEDIAELANLRKYNDELAKSLGFKNFAKLCEHENNDEVAIAMLLGAQYRRLNVVANYVLDHKIHFPTNQEVNSISHKRKH